MTSSGEAVGGTLACLGVSVSFGGVRALADVSIRFPPSGVVALIGPNGAGKTTLLNVLSGFLRPDKGQWYVRGQDVTGFASHRLVRSGLSRTFQDLRLINKITALENVLIARPGQRGEGLLGALLRWGVTAEEAQNVREGVRLLHLVDLDSKASRLAGELSYGEQKRLTIACCLATGAVVLLLDEPVAGVDPEVSISILGLLTRLGREGKLIVLVEHDIAAVRKVADVVIVLESGKVVAQGPPGDILERPEIMEAYLG
jgi:branched-chain amino acid transport system ATP-binding protein